MWILTRTDSAEDQTFWLLAGNKYFVGRKDCQILIEDRSVSRKHAELEIEKPTPKDIKDLSYKPTLTVIDVSRFGTFVNGQKYVNAKVDLHQGDKIMFGTNPNLVYSIEWLPLIFCCSGVTTEQKSSIKSLLCDIGGHINEDLNTSTHLLMPEIKLTSKLIVALALAKPLVNIAFLEAIRNRATCNMELPDIRGYLPSIISEGLGQPSKYYPNPQRTSLFKDKIFVFLSPDQLEKAKEIIIAASGKFISSFEQEDDSFYQKYKTACIIQPKIPKNNTLLPEKVKKFKDMGVNLVKEEDIGLAIVHCDIRKYCNPTGEIPSSQIAPPAPKEPPTPKEPPALSRAVSKIIDSQQHPTLAINSQDLEKKIEIEKRILANDSQPPEEPNKRRKISEPAPIEPQNIVTPQTPSPNTNKNANSKESPQDSEKPKRAPISSLFPNAKPKSAPNKIVIVDDETTTDATEPVSPPKLIKEEKAPVQKISPIEAKPKQKIENSELSLTSRKQKIAFKQPESNSKSSNANPSVSMGKENVENETENPFGKKVVKTAVVGDVDLRFKRPADELIDETAEEKAEKLRIIESKLIAKDSQRKGELPNFKKFRKAGNNQKSEVVSANGFGVFPQKTAEMEKWLAQAENEINQPKEKDELFDDTKPKRKTGK